MTSNQKPLLIAIQAYLLSNLGFDSSYLSKFRLPPIKIRDLEAKSNSKPTVRLEITGIDFLHNYFNVYLSKLVFYSDKGGASSDFEDFSFICKTLYSKAHINNQEIKDLLLKRASGMNNARLLTKDVQE